MGLVALVVVMITEKVKGPALEASARLPPAAKKPRRVTVASGGAVVVQAAAEGAVVSPARVYTTT